MPTTAQTFYQVPAAKDFVVSGESNIRSLTSVVGTADTTTVTQHPNAAGTTSITISPYTSRSTQGDVSATLGWAILKGGADGVGSTATANRLIAAGTWSFAMYVSAPMPGAVTGTLAVTYTANIYRISASNVASLLFSVVSSTQTFGITAGAVGMPITSSQPEYLLLSGESISVGYVISCTQVAGALGATVAGNLTWTFGDTSASVGVPPPGIRTRYPQSLSDNITVSENAQGLSSHPRNISDTAAISESPTRQISTKRSLSDTSNISENLTKSYKSVRSLTDSCAASESLVRLFTANRPITDSCSVSEVISRKFTGYRLVSDAAPMTDTLIRVLVYARGITDSLSTGGGSTTTVIRPTLVFED